MKGPKGNMVSGNGYIRCWGRVLNCEVSCWNPSSRRDAMKDKAREIETRGLGIFQGIRPHGIEQQSNIIVQMFLEI
jgi:hypothetical protein